MKPSAVLVALLAACLATSASRGQVQSQKTIHGLPARQSSTDDWRKLAVLTEVQQIEVIVSWLIEERKKPTPSYTGFGGRTIDDRYTEAQYIHSFMSYDPKTLTWLIASNSIRLPEMRMLMEMALAYAGDRSARQYLIQVLLKSPNPFLREKAACQLMEWSDSDVVAALEHAAATDPFQLEVRRTHIEEEYRDAYIVRESAQASLRVIAEGRKPNAYSRMVQKRYKEKMEGYDEFVKAHKEDLVRIAKLINTDRPKKTVK